jgi:hypothetical protein
VHARQGPSAAFFPTFANQLQVDTRMALVCNHNESSVVIPHAFCSRSVGQNGAILCVVFDPHGYRRAVWHGTA